MTADAAPVIVAAARTPIGTAGHALKDLTVDQLAAPVLASLLERGGLDALAVDEVLLGNCMGPGGDIARVAALAAGLPWSVPALTVDRQCASGLAAIDLGARLVRTGARVVLAGGAESASTAPWRSWPPQAGGEPVRYERAPFAPAADDLEMGLANDLLADEAGVTRERQDAYAARSHRLAVAARDSGQLDGEVVPVAGLARDERPRAGLTAERLSRLPAAFRRDGAVTAGNACGVSDGAAAVAVVSAEVHRRLGGLGLRVLASASSGVAPSRPGRGLVPAARLALEKAGTSLDRLDAIELNEAFAGQVLACCDELGLDPDRVCTQGGALALGHPWGASGAVLVVRLFSQLLMRGPGALGLAAIAAGGGQGVAMVVQSC
ncbi:thiolase family protein [Nocardioides cavernae]|uniref:Probable acetyl-CoA acetyltransferase n=1 Tax=Nocardioides cavernae TaxID=1921566 RepID=A0ABR8NAU2_9ACTN|nr:thiolase family protein [Nocardioides cavernae]MBD3924300.1 thiolase family protein [Nocardioides cavernae]MBM7510758.1 acetyl-CoA C-acetyltransferase [Nocardioides cavernae]